MSEVVELEKRWLEAIKNWVLDIGRTIKFLKESDDEHLLPQYTQYLIDDYNSRIFNIIARQLDLPVMNGENIKTEEELLNKIQKEIRKLTAEEVMDAMGFIGELMGQTHTVFEASERHALGIVLHCSPYEWLKERGLVGSGFPCKIWCGLFVEEFTRQFGFKGRIRRTKKGCILSITKKETT